MLVLNFQKNLKCILLPPSGKNTEKYRIIPPPTNHSRTDFTENFNK